MFYIIPIITILIGVFVDQYTKYLACSHLKDGSISLIEGVFQLHYLENKGAAFGILQNQQLFFIVIGIFALLLFSFVYIRMPREKKFLPLRCCIILMIAGAIGNMIDRMRLNYVIDFFYFEWIDFPIFNVADIYATISAFGLILLFLFYYKEQDFDELWNQIVRKKQVERNDA